METKKKSKISNESTVITISAFPESADLVAPIVGYFPSFYDPLADCEEKRPTVKLLRHREARYAGRMKLVVSPPDSNVEFVGCSFTGEAARPTTCDYALGIFDKEKKTLKIAPITANKIFRLEPQITKSKPVHSESSENLSTEAASAKHLGRKLADLTSLYGTKKDRDKDKKWKLINNQWNDTSSYPKVETRRADGEEDTNAIESHEESFKEAMVARNIPPHDPSADSAEKAYLLDEIIGKNERPYLLDILEAYQCGDSSSRSYPRFVANRIQRLGEIEDVEKREKLARMLSYITHLLSFRERMGNSKHFKYIEEGNAKESLRTPWIVFRKLQGLFVDSESNVISAEKNELIIGYILVLTLFVDNFASDPSDIAADLKMSYQSLRPFYEQLGCKSNMKPFQPPVISLPVPLKFPDLRKRKMRWKFL